MNIKSFAASSGILVLSNVLLKAVNFFLMPIYTAHLTAEMLGISDTVTTFTGLLFPICIMGLDSAFSAFYYDKGERQAEKVFHTIFFVLLAMGAFPIFLCLFSSPISYALFQSEEYGGIVALALASVSFNIWYMPFALNLRMKNKMLLYSLINMASSVGMVILNIIFVVFLQFGAMSLVLSTAIVHMLQLVLFALANQMRVTKGYFEASLLRRMLLFAVPLVPGVILSWVLSLSDRYMLLYFHGLKEVGLYGVGTRLVTVLNIFISSVNMAYTTFAFGSKNDGNAKETYSKVFDLLVFALSAVCCTASVFSREIISMMTAPDYGASYLVVKDLIFAQLFYGITSIVAYGILFEKKSQYTLLANAAGAVANILLNLLLLPTHGIGAAALTTLVGYLITFLCTYFFSQRLYHCSYRIKKAFLWLGVLYGVSCASLAMGFWHRALLWGGTMAVAAVYYRDVLQELCGMLITKRDRGK